MQALTHRAGTVRTLCVATVIVAALAGASTARAVNIAPQGTGIIGVATGTDSAGVPLAHAGTVGHLTDNDPNTVVDTYNEAGTEPMSYVGVLFPAARTDQVRAVTLDMATFFDGGWFGPNNSGPGASQPLTASHLTAPLVQVTTNGGTTWQTVENSNDYVSRLEGTTLPGAFLAPTRPDTATFTLNTPVTGINGIRLIGTEGGTASGGFIGVFDIGVDAVPEPGALGAMGLAGLLALRRRRS